MLSEPHCGPGNFSRVCAERRRVGKRPDIYMTAPPKQDWIVNTHIGRRQFRSVNHIGLSARCFARDLALDYSREQAGLLLESDSTVEQKHGEWVAGKSVRRSKLVAAIMGEDDWKVVGNLSDEGNDAEKVVDSACIGELGNNDGETGVNVGA